MKARALALTVIVAIETKAVMAAAVIATASADLAIVIAVASQNRVQISRRRKAVATVISNVSRIASRANTALKVAVLKPVARNSSRASNSHNELPPLLLLRPHLSKAQRQPQPERPPQPIRNAPLSVVTEVSVASAVVAVVGAVVVVAAVAVATMATQPARVAAIATPKATAHLVIPQAVALLEKTRRLVSRTQAVAAISVAVLQ